MVNWKIDSKNTEIDCQEKYFNLKYIKKHSLKRPLVTWCYISCLFCLQFEHANFQVHVLKEKCMLNQIIATDKSATLDVQELVLQGFHVTVRRGLLLSHSSKFTV